MPVTMMGTLRGKQACRESFQRLFALVPDLHADVHRVGHGKREVFIEFTLSGTYGGKPIAWDAVDRFTFTKESSGTNCPCVEWT